MFRILGRQVVVRVLLVVASLCACQAGVSAGESAVVLVPQPITGVRDGISEPVEFRIVAVPYLNWYHHGPPYTAIAQTNTLLTSAPRAVRLPEANLLALYSIRIGHDPDRAVLYLRLENARRPEGLTTSIRTAGLVALECVRRLTGDAPRPTVKISSATGDTEFWKVVEERFAKHDYTKPFWKPAPEE